MDDIGRVAVKRREAGDGDDGDAAADGNACSRSIRPTEPSVTEKAFMREMDDA